MFIKLLTIALCLSASLADDFKRENHVIVLSKDNFEEVLKSKNVLVEFYAPWCGHCKALEPEYAQAAEALEKEKSEILLAKVDATVETELSDRFKVKGYPTIKFFKEGKMLEYAGGRTADEIIRWVKKKSGAPAQQLTSVDAAKALQEENEVVVVGFFKDQSSPEAKTFLNVADEVEDFVFAITSDDALYSEFKITKDGVTLFKKFDEGQNEYDGDLSQEDDLKKFLQSKSLPLVIEFTHKTAQRIFSGDIKSHNLLFTSKGASDYESTLEVFRNVAKEFKDKVLFVTIDTDNEDHERIMEFFGLQKEDTPTMRIIQLEEEMKRFKPETEGLSDKEIRDFVIGVQEGKIGQHLLTENIPEDWDKEPVKVLVGKNFDEVAFDKAKNVLVEFYAPWCGHCKQLIPIYDELGEKYKDNADVVIAKMDATANELKHTKINSFPTIKLYKKGTNEVIDFNGERTLAAMTKFIDTDGVDGAAVKEEEQDEEEEKDDDQAKRDEL